MEISLSPSIKNTCAVIVTYYPDKDIASRLRQIQKQLPSIIIIDNASSKTCLSVLREFSLSPTVDLHENDENEGIGKALNQAASLAIASGFSWMLTLDQDTLIHGDMFDTLVMVYKATGCRAPCIGSNYWNASKNKEFLRCGSRANREFVERRTVITSGTLLKLDLFKRIGGFREDYFIDSIDHEYCLRIRANGLPVVMSCQQLMSHSIGSTDSHGSRLLAFDHPPARKYYMARNTLVTLKCYITREPAWAVCQFARLIVEFLSIALLERDKRNKASAFGRGISDAVKNRMGRCGWA